MPCHGLYTRSDAVIDEHQGIGRRGGGTGPDDSERPRRVIIVGAIIVGSLGVIRGADAEPGPQTQLTRLGGQSSGRLARIY
jgi:hypothetical protein